jgi:hypothetical protein
LLPEACNSLRIAANSSSGMSANISGVSRDGAEPPATFDKLGVAACPRLIASTCAATVEGSPGAGAGAAGAAGRAGAGAPAADLKPLSCA